MDGLMVITWNRIAARDNNLVILTWAKSMLRRLQLEGFGSKISPSFIRISWKQFLFGVVMDTS